MRNFALGIVVTLVVLAFASWLYLRLGYADLRAKAEPSWLESELAVTAMDASAARHALGQQNPVPSTEANLLDGARLYRDKCADCHGRPDNPVSDYGRAFYPRVPQFMNARPSLPENQTFYIIKYGVRWTAMPAWEISWPTARSGKQLLFSVTSGICPLQSSRSSTDPPGALPERSERKRRNRNSAT